MPSAEYQSVVNHLRDLFATPFPDPHDVAAVVAANRALLHRYARVEGHPLALDPGTVVTSAVAGGVPSEWVCAVNADPSRRLCWIHGGAWISGCAADYRHVAETLSRVMEASVLSLDYRLAPEHPFPAGLDDCQIAFHWMLANGPQRPGPARAAWIAGDSAGGNLALALLLRLRDAREPLPAAAATVGAATDLTASSASMRSRSALDPIISKRGIDYAARLYVQDGTPLTDPLVSPLFGELHGLPPVRMHVGDCETLLDDTLRFAERARAAGSSVEAKVWPEMVHVFEAFCHLLPEARASLAEIGDFLIRHER
jgi:acetyl esterase/lipase